MSSSLGAWSRALLVVLAVLCVGAVVAVACCAAIIVADELDDTDDWDGIGTLIGVYGGALASLVLAATLALVALVRSARRTESRSQLVLASGVCTYAGGIWLAGSVYVGSLGGDPAPIVASSVGALALLVPALGVIVAANRQGRVDART